MKFESKYEYLNSRKCIWKYRLRNDDHFVQGGWGWGWGWVGVGGGGELYSLVHGGHETLILQTMFPKRFVYENVCISRGKSMFFRVTAWHWEEELSCCPNQNNLVPDACTSHQNSSKWSWKTTWSKRKGRKDLWCPPMRTQGPKEGWRAGVLVAYH